MSLPSRGTRSAPGPAKILPLGVWAEAEGARPGRHNGNQLTETVGDETVSMGYTPDNRLKTYSRMSSAPVVGEDEDETPHQVSYAYDAQGRRVAKSQWGREGSKTQTYQYEGMGLDLIRISDAQRLTTSAEAADEDELLRRPLVESERALVVKPRSREHYEGNGMDIVYANGRVFSSLSQNNGLTIYTTDVLGSVRFTSNNHDWAQHTYDYDAFGTSLRTPPSLFGYNGKVYDPVTASYNYGYRDYAPKQGRFTTVDPIQDGSNWYAYVGNDPVNYTDPNGLEAGDPKYNASMPRQPREVLTQTIGSMEKGNGSKPGIMGPIQFYEVGHESWVKDGFGSGSFGQESWSDAAGREVSPTEKRVAALTSMVVDGLTLGVAPAAVGTVKGLGQGFKVSAEMAQAAVEGAPLKTQQQAVSLPAVQRYVDKLLAGQKAPPIVVDKGIIVEGNHRYVAGRIVGKEPEIMPGTGGMPEWVTDWGKFKIDPVDWGNR